MSAAGCTLLFMYSKRFLIAVAVFTSVVMGAAVLALLAAQSFWRSLGP